MTVPVYNMTDTWNNAGTVFNAILMNVTDTGHAAGSSLLRLQLGGVDQLVFDAAGGLAIGNQGTLVTNFFGDTPALQISNGAGVNQANIDMRRYSANTSPAYISAVKSRSNSIGVGGTLQADDETFSLDSQGYDATGTPALQRSCLLRFSVDGSPTAGSVPGRIVLGCNGSGENGDPTERVRISSAGVNIGNFGPTKANVFSQLPMLQVSTGGSGLDFSRYSNDQFMSAVTFSKSRSDTIGTGATVSSGDTILYLTCTAYDATGTPALRESVSISAFVDAAPTAGSVAGRLQFGTNASGTSGNPTERMRIDSAGLKSFTNGAFGYGLTGNGDGGTVTQGTSRTTAVTLNTTCGAITLFTAAPTVGTWVTFTVNNTKVAATDTVLVDVKSGTNTYIALVSATAANSFNITFQSVAGTSSDAPVINFSVIKAVTS